MTDAPTTPSPERQPADAGVRERLFQMVVDCEADPECSLMLSSSVAAEHARDLRAILSAPAPQAQPDARAVEALKTAEKALLRFCDRYIIEDREDDIAAERAIQAIRDALSAPAADDGWRPSREDVARAVHKGRFPDDRLATPFDYESREAQAYCYRITDAILALQPAAPTDAEKRS